MRKLFSIAALGLAAVAAAPQAEAQGILPFSVGVRGGAAFPTGDFGEDDVVETGWGFEVNAKYQLLPMIAVYGAYDRFSFGTDFGEFEGAFGDTEVDLVDSGFALGGQFSVPLVGMATGLSPWVRAGAIFNQLSTEVSGDLAEAGQEFGLETESESERSLGFEIGGGVSFPLGQVISVTPGVRYRTYSPEFEGQEESDENISYIVLDVGLTFGL
jgi:opacity protein-like surface antigen